MFFWGFGLDDYHEALSWLNGLLPRVQVPAANGPASETRLCVKARGLTTAGMLNLAQGNIPESIAAFAEAIPLERKVGDTFYLAFALAIRTSLAMMNDDMAGGKPAAEEAAALMRTLNNRQWLVLCLPFLLAIESRLGHVEKAAQLRQEVNSYLDQARHPVFMPALMNLGLEARARHQMDEARIYFQRGLALARQLKSLHFVAVMESELAHMAREQGELQTAETAYCRLIRTWMDLGRPPAVAHQLESFAFVAVSRHDLDRAARLLGAAEMIRENIRAPMRRPEQVEYDAAVAELRARMDAPALATAWSQGRAMDMERAIQYAVTAADPAEPVSQP